MTAIGRPLDVRSTGLAQTRHGFARGPVLAIATVTTLLILAFSGRYGYHRDELYFIACGHHLAWGYPDQPALAPLLARIMTAIDPHSVTVLRLPSTIAAFADLVLTALTAREIGADRTGQALAAGLIAASGFFLGGSHLLSTATIDFFFWVLLIWLVLRILRGADPRLWVVAGIVAGVGLNDSDLVAFLAASLGIGVLVSGPRSLFASRWLWIGVAIAAVMWAPYVVWQAQHGLPELTVARSIAAGNSGTSVPRWAILPDQILLVGPPLSPFLVAGFVSMLRNPSYRWCRSLPVAAIAGFGLFLLTGGKAYYLAGFFPVLLSAGAIATIGWVQRHRSGRAWVRIAFIASIPTLFITLPIVPLSVVHSTPIVALNYDAGETIGWPLIVREIGGVYSSIPVSQRPTTSIITSNYGEAGAIAHYGPALGLPPAYSGNMSFYLWGPPAATTQTVVAVGFDRSDLVPLFGSVRLVRQLSNGHQVDDDEQGANVFIASAPRMSWSQLWKRLKDYS